MFAFIVQSLINIRRRRSYHNLSQLVVVLQRYTPPCPPAAYLQIVTSCRLLKTLSHLLRPACIKRAAWCRDAILAPTNGNILKQVPQPGYYSCCPGEEPGECLSVWALGQLVHWNRRAHTELGYCLLAARRL